MTESTVLICTVGGSHEPIVKAIRDAQPDFVCFICTGRDQSTGQSGSEVQITGKGMVIKASASDSTFNLPNIVTQAGLNKEQFQVSLVPSDDLDQAYQSIESDLIRIKHRFPAAMIIANYTGGTKTMAAALAMASLETDGVSLSLVTGARSDLIQVRTGTEANVSIAVERLRLLRAMKPLLNAWQRFAFGEAAKGLESIAVPSKLELRSRLLVARDMSRAFDAWDRFDHVAAAELLSTYRAKIGKVWGVYLTIIESITAPENDPRREPALLLDLWRNAERRANQCRYDDALARVYRLIEWTAQWLLRSRVGLDTADLDAGQIPDDIRVTRNRDGKVQAGLLAAWDLVSSKLDSEASEFARRHRKRMQDHIKSRNESILAHGFVPVTQDNWQKIQGWMIDAFIPMLELEARRAGIRLMPPQLPATYELLD